MSSVSQPVAPAADDRPFEVVVISHSPIFYWWPVWAVGFLMAGLTYWYGYQVAFVPPGTVAEARATSRRVRRPAGRSDRPGGSAAAGRDRDRRAEATPAADDGEQQPGRRLGMTLCLVVVITHVHLRGLWSVIAILVLGFTTVLLAVLGLWDPILRAVRVIDIHINGFGYLSISLFLLVVWLLTYLLYDRQRYMVFTRGQLRVRAAIGGGETVYDTRGMVVEKHRADLFRHWLLGFGSGDLTVRTAGTNPREFEMPNVLGIDRKLALINTMVQEREVVQRPH